MANRLFARAGVVAAAVVAGLAAIATASVSVSAPAPDQDSAAGRTRQAPKCLDLRNVGRIHVVDDHTLLVYDGFGNPYQLDVGGPCRSMNDMSQIGFEINGIDQLCRAHDAMILHSNMGEAPVRCLINGVKPITRAQADEIDQG